MELHENDKVRYLTFKNQVSDEICTIIEICDNGKTVRLKKPNEEIMRIHHDRIRPLEGKIEMKNDKADKNDDTKKIDPWSGINNGEVWIKQSKFSDTITLKSFVVINLDNNTYKSMNTYNDKFSNAGIKEFKLKNYESHVSKLEKKGYKKLNRSAK